MMPAPPPPEAPAEPPAPAGIRRVAGDFLAVLRFYSRLPGPTLRSEGTPHAMPDFSRASWAIPLVGALIGLCGAVVGLGAYLIGLSTGIAAILTVASLVVVTGAFHEDGLADACDGLWGGASRERRLEIMKDSRIGTFGAAALALALALRIFALTELFRLIGPSALVLVIGIAAASRPLALIPVLVLPPAQGTGLSAEVPMPDAPRLGLATLIGIGILAGCATYTDLLPAAATGLMVLIVVFAIFVRIADRKLGGHTGDILGACQQGAEITLLLVFSAAANWNGPV